MGEKLNTHGVLVGKSKRKRPLGRPRCRRVNNVKMDFRMMGWGDTDCIFLA
jgi:hypothetical protein